MTPERAMEIIQQAKDRQHTGPWSDQIRHVITPAERLDVLVVWATMPGDACFVDALNRIARGES